MNSVHLHLLLNHIPVLGTIFGLLLFAIALWKHSEDLKRAALGLFVIAAIAAIPTYVSGEPSEDAVKSLPGVGYSLIERHEDAAAIALGGVLALGIAALAGLAVFRHQRRVPPWFCVMTLLGALLVSGAMSWTGSLGGQIRHSEIRPDSGGQSAPPARSHHE